MLATSNNVPVAFVGVSGSSSSPAFRPNRPLTTRTPNLSNSCMTHSRVGLGLIVDLQALVKAFARAHFSSASAEEKVPNAIVFPAHYVLKETTENNNCGRK